MMNPGIIDNALTRPAVVREKLAEAALAETLGKHVMPASSLLHLVQELATAEVDYRLAHGVKARMERDDPMTFTEAVASTRAYLMEELLSGPDDTWSGRGNDLKRVEYQAKLDWAKNAAYVSEY